MDDGLAETSGLRAQSAPVAPPVPGTPAERHRPPGQPGHDPGNARRRAWHRAAEHGAVLLLCLLVLALHDVGYLLRQPYWNDEAWVAVTTRFPVTQLPALTSSTPIGWSLLARLATVGRGQSGRLLALGFAAAAVLPGYWLARRLDWKDRGSAFVAGTLAAAAVLLVPAMLVRDDLKQYTADACMALLVLAVTARLERQWSWRGLVALSACACGGMLISEGAAFAGTAAFAAICLVQLAQRSWRRLGQSVVAAVCTAVLGGLVYTTFDARSVLPGLTRYWQDYFMPVHNGLAASAGFVIHNFELMRAYFGLGPGWLAVPLVLAGLVTLARLGRPATAAAVVLLWPEMITLSALGKYPFLDLRTSTFLITVTAVVAAIGVAGICALVRSRLRGGAAATAVSTGLAAVALTGFGLAAGPYVRSHEIPFEPIRQQTQYVASHAAPGDPIVVSANSNWGFAYYWPAGRVARRRDLANLQLYQAYFPAQPRIIVARQRSFRAIDAAMKQALRRLRPGACERIWLVRTHENVAEFAAWNGVLHRLGLTPVRGPYSVAYIQEGPASCR